VRRWMLAISIVVLAGCASLSAQYRMSQFDDMTRAYERAIQWSEFATAYSAMERTATSPPFDTSVYQDIKVTSYDALSMRAADEGKTIRRTVRIGYVHLVNMAELSVTTEEEWVYSDAAKRWYLRSGFPVFK
jgi:hypothetical protein